MPHLVVIGGGTAGAMTANKLRSRLKGWDITVVDPAPIHYYQPGFLFVPVGMRPAKALGKPTQKQLKRGVRLVVRTVDRVEPEANQVHFTDGTSMGYDWLIVATGTTPRPEETPGMTDDMGGAVHQYYTFEGAVALRDALAKFNGGKVVVHVTEMPIKCPVAPLEMAFLADAFLTKKGVRDRTEITYVTPLPGAFTKPVASKLLGDFLDSRNIKLESDFVIESVDAEGRKIVSYDEREVPYDLLITIPLNMGADFVSKSGLGDEMNFVVVDKGTMQSKKYDNVFAVGDATNLPTSKAGSVAHFAVHEFVDNFVDYTQGKPMTHVFDGHANCFIETGFGKAMLLDFNYETEPLPGVFPLPKIGPLTLLKESRVNHWSKMAFEAIYWYGLVPGRPLPFPSKMSMTGKDTTLLTAESTESKPLIPDF